MGANSDNPGPEILEIARSSETDFILERLLTLTAGSIDIKYVCAYLSQISSGESIATLGAWASDNVNAKHLERLAVGIWSAPRLAERLAPVKSDQRVSKKFRDALIPQYLAAMATARRPELEEPVARWTQQLRLLIMVRALDALGNGYIHEKNLANACLRIRQACDVTGDPRGAWLAELVGDEPSFFDFCEDLHLQCAIQLSSKKWPSNARTFFRSLQTIANGKGWKPLTMLGHTDDLDFDVSTHKQIEEPKLAPFAFLHLHPDEPQGAVYVRSSPVSSMSMLVGSADEKQTRSRNARIGTGLILETVEDVQYLRHTWHHLSEAEEQAFDNRVESLLSSKDPTDRLGAALVLIATLTCRPMSNVGRIPLSANLDDDWTLNPKRGLLQRRPPRFDRGWEATTAKRDAREWLQPMTSSWAISLCAAATDVIASTNARLAAATDVASLWTAISPESDLEFWFNHTFSATAELARLSGPCTAHVLVVRSYERTHNQGLARLIGSQTRTGLPSSCAYGAYRSPVVNSTITAASAAPLYSILTPRTDEDLNVCGSELDLLKERVRVEIERLITRANATATEPDKWIDHHNLLTSIAVIALLASTGARPVNSPFESLRWFDFDQLVLYVEDKVTGPTRSSRVCVLSDIANKIMVERYLPHLSALAVGLESTAPRFSAEISRLVQCDDDVALPLFFYIRGPSQLGWIELTEQQLQIHSGIEWPLPWNLFRHFHATELVRRGLDAEIVAALLSHADSGAESHGDFSLRIPREDLELARPYINALQVDLGLTLPALGDLPYSTLASGAVDIAFSETRLFGRAARKKERLRSLAAARERAQKEIDLAIGERPPEALSPHDWELIAHDMLFRQDNVPHPAASIRYDVFEAHVDKLWNKHRTLTRIRRTFTLVPDAKVLFNEDVIGSEARLRNLRAIFEREVSTLGDQQLGPTLAAALAALDLVFNSRVAHIKALLSLVCQQDCVKLVKFDSKYWFEWSDAQVWRDGRPMFRVNVSPRAGRWIGMALSGGRTLKVVPTIPKVLQPLMPGIEPGQALKRLLDEVVGLQDQANCWRLPGTDAAYLAGRLMFPALPHADWYRALKGAAPLLPQGSTVNEADVDTEDIYFMAHHAHATAAPKDAFAVEKCAALFDKIRELLAREGSDADSCRRAVEKELQAAGYGHGDMPFALGHFAVQILARKSKKGRHAPLRISTVERYWDSLAPPVCDLAHDVNLLDMEEDELTELYCDLIEWWTSHFEAKEAAMERNSKVTGKESEQQLPVAERAADAARRTLEQLKEFHDFAVKVFGIEEPDWSEISSGSVGSIGRPGFVLTSEYQSALRAIHGGLETSKLSNADLTCCLVLIACARFGLRIAEATGLYRRDWIDIAGTVVVLVRANNVRPIKTRRSRRQVPLIGLLSDLESDVVKEVLRRWDNLNKIGEDGPLLADVTATSFKSLKAGVGSRLREELKVATCNDSTTVHMLRHSFATRILALLRGAAIGHESPPDFSATRDARLLLLGTDTCDRRVLWAVSRLLGHASPGITSRCYLHGVDMWIPEPQQDGTWGGAGISARALIDLDSAPVNAKYGRTDSTPRRRAAEVSEPELLRLVRYWRLIVQGQTHEAALNRSKASVHIASNFLSILQKCIDRPDDILKKSEVNKDIADIDRHLELLRPIRLERWNALARLTEGCVTSIGVPETLDVAATIGRRRQIVLFQESHFRDIASFVSCLGLTEGDIRLVPNRGLHSSVEGWMDTHSLRRFSVKAEDVGKTMGKSFQIDTAISGDPPTAVWHRVVVVPTAANGKFSSTYELVALWLGWWCAQSMPLRANATIDSGLAEG